jgi:hypothetical protein
MNIEISATREIWFKNRDGETKTEWQTSYFNAIQTNSSTTFDILESQDKKLAYIDAVMRVFWHDDAGKEHVDMFLEWVDRVELAGYTINFEMI